jgi:hypothetical protein
MIDAQGIATFYKALAKCHAEKRREAEDQNSFLWARLINLIQVIGNSELDGSGFKDVRSEAETVAKELMEQLTDAHTSKS